MGGPRGPAARDVRRPAQRRQPGRLRRRRHRYAGARGRLPHRPLGRGPRRGGHARRRCPDRHRRDGHQGGDHHRRRQAAPGRHPGCHPRRQRRLGRCRSQRRRRHVRTQPARRRHPRVRQPRLALRRPARPGRRRRRGRARPQGRARRGDGRDRQALLRRRRRDDLRAAAPPLPRAERPPRLDRARPARRVAGRHLPSSASRRCSTAPLARVHPETSGPIERITVDVDDPAPRTAAVDQLVASYPEASQLPAAPGRRALLRRGVPSTRQARELRPRDRRRRTPLVEVRLAVAGPRRVLRGRPGDRHPRPGVGGRDHRQG